MNFSIGFMGAVLLIILNLGRTVLLTKNLCLADYGRVLVVINFFAFLSIFLGLRVNDFLYRFFHQFKESREQNALKGVLLISLFISLMVGFFIAIGTYILSPWIAKTFYHDQTYVPLFRIYSIAAFFLAFEGFCTAILRLHNRFVFIVLPQVAGAALSMVLLGLHLLFYTQVLSLKYVITAIMAGMLIATLPTLIIALVYVKRILVNGGRFEFLLALKEHRRKIVSTLFQTNLVGYLKLGTSTGGMFLLGVFSTASQVALFGIAHHMANVFRVLQNNIQNAVTPEIVALWSQKKVKQLYKLINVYTKTSLIGGAIIALISILIAKPVILFFTTAQYLDALPIFYILIGTIYLTFVSVVFFPLALCMDQMGRRNLIVSISFVYLLIGVFIGLNSYSLAIVLFLGALTTRLLNDIPLLIKLRNLSLKPVYTKKQ